MIIPMYMLRFQSYKDYMDLAVRCLIKAIKNNHLPRDCLFISFFRLTLKETSCTSYAWEWDDGGTKDISLYGLFT